MTVQRRTRDVFGYFQNLNLLALIQDLRRGQTARQTWSSGNLLCPVAHGLPAGRHVRELSVMGQEFNLRRGCDYAASYIRAESAALFRFISAWDEESDGHGWLLRQLEELWDERVADADAVQEVLRASIDLGDAVPSIISRSSNLV